MSYTSESILNHIDLEQTDVITVRPNIDGLIMQMHHDDWMDLAHHAENREHGVLRVLRRAHELDVLPNMDDDALRIAYLSILLRSVPHRKDRSLRQFNLGLQYKMQIDDVYFDEWSSWSDDHGWAITILNRSPEDYVSATEHFETISQQRQTWDFLFFEGITNRDDLIDLTPFFMGLHWLNGYTESRKEDDDSDVLRKNSQPWITKGLSFFRRNFSDKVLFAHHLIDHLNYLIVYPSIRNRHGNLRWNDNIRQEQILLFLAIQTRNARIHRDIYDEMVLNNVLPGISGLSGEMNRGDIHPDICDEMDHDPVLAKIKTDIQSKSGSIYDILRILCELRGLNSDDIWGEIKKRKVPVEIFRPILQGLIDHARIVLNIDLEHDFENDLELDLEHKFELTL